MPIPHAGAQAPGRRFQVFFVAVCRDARMRANASYERIADLAGVTSESVRRFEKGQTWPTTNLETYAAAYGEVDGLDDARDLFQRALDWWRMHGRRPQTSHELEQAGPESDTRRLIEEIRQAGEHERARAEAATRPTSTRKRRAAGG